MILLILAAALKLLFAHELTLVKTGEGFLLTAGHESTLQLDPSSLKTLCLDSEGEKKKVIVEKVKEGILFKGRCGLLAVVYSEGKYRAFLKYVVNPSLLTKRVGLDFEILAKEKKTPEAGRKITFFVLYRGASLRGVPVAVNHRVVGRTRLGGEIRLRVRKGRNEITAFLLRGDTSLETTLLFDAR